MSEFGLSLVVAIVGGVACGGVCDALRVPSVVTTALCFLVGFFSHEMARLILGWQ